MTNPRPLSPEGFRTAAYLAARERMDNRTGKTRNVVQCEAPNKKCGNRCIPPQWDCRLKGEGVDPHLAARRTDPISGFANIERGFNRLGKFARSGSFAELDAGKRSLIRGAVKLKPGDLKEKNDFKEWVEKNYARIAVPLFVGGGLISAHAVLKGGNVFGYKHGFGRKVDEAASKGIGAVLDALPFVGHARAHTRKQSAAASSASINRAQRLQAINELAERSPAAIIANTPIAPTLIKGNSALNTALRSVDSAGANNTFHQWNVKHRQAFWGASHPAKTSNKLADDELFLAGRSIYAEPAARAFLHKQWQLNIPADSAREQYISAIKAKLDVETDAYLQLAKQQGYRIQGRPGAEFVHKDDRDDFVTRAVRGIKNDKERTLQAAFISNSVSGKSPAARARRTYESTTEGFDAYYKKVAKNLEDVAGAPSNDPDLLASGLVSLRGAAERRRIDYMMQASPSRVARKTSAGPAHDQLFLKDYYHTRVAGRPNSTYSLSNSEAIRAASELSGNEIRTSTEAIQILQQQGFTNARLEVRRRTFNRGIGEVERDARIIADRLAAGYTRREAEAYLRALKQQRRRPRGRTDSSDTTLTPRERAYYRTQARLDKRCGKSGIRENQKCTKVTPAQSEEARLRERGATDPGVTCRPGTQPCGKICIPEGSTCYIKGNVRGQNLSSKLAKVAFVSGAVTGVVLGSRHAYRTRHTNQLYRSSANHISKGIQAMSSKNVRDGISKLPKQWQDPANRLVGKAKVGLAYVAADAQGLKIKHVDADNNFSTWHNEETGHVLSIGAVDDTLVTFVSERKGKAGSFDKYGVAFQTDLSFSQKEGVTKAQSLAVSKQVKSMFQNQLDQLPENAVLFNKPFKDDGLGDKRASIYKRFKFRELPGVRGSELYALKNQGKLTAIPDEQADYVAQLIKGGDTEAARERYNSRRRGDAKEVSFSPRVMAYLTAKQAFYAPT